MNQNSKYFKKKNLLPIDKFFEDVLYNKKYGYYTNHYPFGGNGDYITSPMISFLFGEMLAIWTISFWESLGKPKKFNLIELGPGNGMLAKTLIKTFKKFPNFYKSLNFFLMEKSNSLKKFQKQNFSRSNIKWISSLDEITKGPVLFLGNEFFDAIPIKQFKRIKKSLYENYVGLDQNNKVKIKLVKSSSKIKKKIDNFKFFKKVKFIEYPEMGIETIEPIINKIKKLNGGVLLVDYGYVDQTNVNTLQSIKNHKKNNVFENLGQADVTSLVNFKLLREHFRCKNLIVKNVVTQSFFLKKLGILERAERISLNMSFKEKSDLHSRLKRLLNPYSMGELFKVFFAFKKNSKNIIGFE
jgi:NADH dehydrogenase [ubiquinone] 1 alpha subcomplex assembly factor 7